jgi:hypothetical protein
MDVAQIDWRYLDEREQPSLKVGELVSTEAGGMPIYRIMSLGDGRAWLRNIDDDADRLTPLADFHWRAEA